MHANMHARIMSCVQFIWTCVVLFPGLPCFSKKQIKHFCWCQRSGSSPRTVTAHNGGSHGAYSRSGDDSCAGVLAVLSVSMQIISSSTPCRDFFFRCCRGLELQQGEKTSRMGAKKKTVSTPDNCTSDPAAIAKKCNELDLTIIVIWKVVLFQTKTLDVMT